MAEAPAKRERQSSLAKKAAITLAALGGLAALAKHKDILPAVLARGRKGSGATEGGSLRHLKTLATLRRLHLSDSKASNSLRHLVDQETLASPEYQQTAAGIAERLKRLPEKNELKQDAYRVGGALLGSGLSKRKASKKAKLLGAASLLTLGAKHNAKVTANATKILKRAKPKSEQLAKYMKTLPAAKSNDFFRDRFDVMKERNPPPENTGVAPMDTSGGCLACSDPPKVCRTCGRGFTGNQWADKRAARQAAAAPAPTPAPEPAAPGKKKRTWKDTLKTAAKVALPLAAVAAAAYGGKKAYQSGKLPALANLKTKIADKWSGVKATDLTQKPAAAAILPEVPTHMPIPKAILPEVQKAIKSYNPSRSLPNTGPERVQFTQWAERLFNKNGKYPQRYLDYINSEA